MSLFVIDVVAAKGAKASTAIVQSNLVTGFSEHSLSMEILLKMTFTENNLMVDQEDIWDQGLYIFKIYLNFMHKNFITKTLWMLLNTIDIFVPKDVNSILHVPKMLGPIFYACCISMTSISGLKRYFSTTTRNGCIYDNFQTFWK